MQYKKLKMLKEAFYIDDEVNEIMLLKRARKHNEEELYIISYLVDLIMTAPQVLREQFNLLNSCCETEYKRIYNETKELFRTNPKFKKFSDKIYRELDLFDVHNLRICNMTIFGLCAEIITGEVKLSSKNFCMNLHILQKWLKMQREICLSSLPVIEQKIILYLANGYTPQNLIDEKYFDISDERLKAIIYDVIPARLGVQSICQAMAVIYMNNPDLRDIKKSLKMFDEISKDDYF